MTKFDHSPTISQATKDHIRRRESDPDCAVTLTHRELAALDDVLQELELTSDLVVFTAREKIRAARISSLPVQKV